MIQQCSEQVWYDAWHKKQCEKKAIVQRDGKWYCKVHDPEYIKQKDTERQAKYEANKCQGCGYLFNSRFERQYFVYCPLCGTKRIKSKD